MANFAVAAGEDVVARGKELLEKYMLQGEKQSDALIRIFNVAEENLESDQLAAAGVDAAELDATLSHLRSIYAGAVSGRKELIEAHEREIENLKDQHQRSEAMLQEKLSSMEESCDQIEQSAQAEHAAADSLRSQTEQLQARIEQLKLDSEKSDKLIGSLEAEKSRLQTELNKTTGLSQENVSLKEKIVSLQAETEKQKMEYEREQFKVQKEHQDAIVTLKNEHLEQISKLMAEHREEINALRSNYEAEIQNHKKAYVELQKIINPITE